MELIIACKKCKKVFKKDLVYVPAAPPSAASARSSRARAPAASALCRPSLRTRSPNTACRQELEDSDEYCPYCDNHFVIEAAEARPVITIEGDDPRLVRDHRVKAALPLS